MATRAQVKVIQDMENVVYLYQHHDGHILYDTVVSVLKRRERLGDPEYLTRMIFSKMIADDIEGSTGFGIGLDQHFDIEYLVIVDIPKRTVTEYHINSDEVTEILRSLRFEDL